LDLGGNALILRSIMAKDYHSYVYTVFWTTSDEVYNAKLLFKIWLTVSHISIYSRTHVLNINIIWDQLIQSV
jgi:hypothetical protein